MHAPDDKAGKQDDRRYDERHRVGFRNVSPYLLSPDQIIDGDEIESRTELVPKEPFGGGDENEYSAIDDGKGGEYPEYPPFREKFIWHEEAEQQPRRCGEHRCREVEKDADAERAQQRRTQADFPPCRDEQGEAGDDGEDKEQAECDDREAGWDGGYDFTHRVRCCYSVRWDGGWFARIIRLSPFTRMR